MDSEIVYALVGIVIFILIVIFTLRSDSIEQIQTKEEKQYQIINEYTKQLRSALEPLRSDKQAMLAKKSELLKKFSDELALNIFFNTDEIREIIQDLSSE